MDASLIPRLPLSGFPVSRVALDQPHQGSPEGKESVSLLKVLLILVTAEGCGLCPAGPCCSLHSACPSPGGQIWRPGGCPAHGRLRSSCRCHLRVVASLSAGTPPHSACCEAQHCLPPLSGRKGKPVEFRSLVISPPNC